MRGIGKVRMVLERRLRPEGRKLMGKVPSQDSRCRIEESNLYQIKPVENQGGAIDLQSSLDSGLYDSQLSLPYRTTFTKVNAKPSGRVVAPSGNLPPVTCAT